MPRQATLNQLRPNKFYKINATIKYQHIGEQNITAIIEQDNAQSKVCIPKEGIQLEQGNTYSFDKCFNSRNGWLYVKNPTQTVHPLEQTAETQNSILTLAKIYTDKDQYVNRYVTVNLKVIEIGEKQTVTKNDKELILYKLRCFADGLIIQLTVWQHEIKEKDLKNKILTFEGFKVNELTSKTITLASTVYSKIYEPDLMIMNNSRNMNKRFNYHEHQLYQNVSSIYILRNIDQINNACQLFHKNHSIITAKINQLQQLTYEGCSKCKKKIQSNKCYQCGSNITKAEYKYCRAVLEDQKGMLECAIFDEETQTQLKQSNKESKQQEYVFNVISTARTNPETNQKYWSHVVTKASKQRNPLFTLLHSK